MCARVCVHKKEISTRIVSLRLAPARACTQTKLDAKAESNAKSIEWADVDVRINVPDSAALYADVHVCCARELVLLFLSVASSTCELTNSKTKPTLLLSCFRSTTLLVLRVSLLSTAPNHAFPSSPRALAKHLYLCSRFLARLVNLLRYNNVFVGVRIFFVWYVLFVFYFIHFLFFFC